MENYSQGYPCFIKPKDGSSSIDAYKVENEEELYSFAERVADYIVQPFIEGREYTVDILCDFEGNPIYVTPRERLAVRSGYHQISRLFLGHEQEVYDQLWHAFLQKQNAIDEMLRQQGVPFEQMAYVGDNINKDFHAPRMLGMRGIHLQNEDGLYY